MATECQGYSGKREIPEGSEDSKLKSRIWPHHFHFSPDYALHMEKVFLIVKNYDRKPTNALKNLDVNTAFWGYSCLSHFKLQFILDEITH